MYPCDTLGQIANAFYYNTPLALGILQRFGIATDIFTLWFQMLQEKKKSGGHANFKRWVNPIFFKPLSLSSPHSSFKIK